MEPPDGSSNLLISLNRVVLPLPDLPAIKDLDLR